MSALAVEQPDLWGDTPTVGSEYVPGVGRVLTSPNGGWRARWTGARYGWQIDRAITWLEPHTYWTWNFTEVLRWDEVTGWEGWEPDLPYGVEHITDRDDAIAHLTVLTDELGDDPRWLQAIDRRLRATLRG